MTRTGRGGDRKSGQTYGENTLKYFPLCLWCGQLFASARPDAKTCGPRCRVALARYVAKHGQPPLFPFGLTPDPKRAKQK